MPVNQLNPGVGHMPPLPGEVTVHRSDPGAAAIDHGGGQTIGIQSLNAHPRRHLTISRNVEIHRDATPRGESVAPPVPVTSAINSPLGIRAAGLFGGPDLAGGPDSAAFLLPELDPGRAPPWHDRIDDV